MSFMGPLDGEGEEMPPVIARLLQQQQQAHEQIHRQLQDFEMAVEHLFQELTPKQLATLRRMFDAIVGGASPTSSAAYFSGQASAILYAVHHVCADCGEDHAEAELLKSSNTGDEESNKETE